MEMDTSLVGSRNSNPLHLSNTNDLASNSLRRFTGDLVFCGQNSGKFSRYYSLPVNGNDSTERRDMLFYINHEEFELSKKEVWVINKFYQMLLKCNEYQFFHFRKGNLS